MLAVQVQYLGYLENKRHNLAQEDIGYRNIIETNRHNLVTESQEATRLDQNQQAINESIRHNQATEAIGYMQANAALQQASTQRMLVEAQVPLIQAQAKGQAIENEINKSKAYYAKQYNAYATETKRLEGQYKQLEVENYTALHYLKAIGDIIPF